MKNEKAIDYFLQLIMVILGVFLGMMASEWSSNRNLEKDKKSLLLGLKNELQNNLDYLKSRKENDIIPFFNSLDSLTKHLNKHPEALNEKFKSKSFNERIPNFPGLRRQVDDSMFEATKFSNMLAYFDIALLQQLSKTYSLQYNIQETRNIFLQKLIEIDSQTIYDDVVDLLWEIMQSYFGAQYKLIEEYEKSIQLIDQSLE